MTTSDRMERKKAERHKLILRAAREIAAAEGWGAVTVRRLSEKVDYSQPVLYSHFGSRDGILAAVALEGFREIAKLLERARNSSKELPKVLRALARCYLDFARQNAAVYEVMFSLRIMVPFAASDTPVELRSAFRQLCTPFESHHRRPEIAAELFWAALHGLAELARAQRIPELGQCERIEKLVWLYGQREDA
jgi:AcrR family transcriptional regulator